MTTALDKLDNGGADKEVLRQAISAYTDDAPDAPSANDIITERAHRISNGRTVGGFDHSTGSRRLLLPILGGVGVIAAVVVALVLSRDTNNLVTEPGVTEVPVVDETDDGQPEAADDTTSEESPSEETPEETPPVPVEFEVVDRPQLPDGRPATFWAITDDTNELVEVDTLSGEVLGRYGGWGEPDAECAAADDCTPPRITDVEIGADGRLWVSDCCDAAGSSTFIVEPGAQFDPESTPRIDGRSASVSPNGQLVAVVVGEDKIEIRETGNEPDQPPLTTYDLPEDPNTAPAFFGPVAWFDDTTLVLTGTVETSSLLLLDISDAANPTVVGEPSGGVLPFVGSAVRSDGTVVVAAFAIDFDKPGNGSVMGWAYEVDPSTGIGERIDDVDLAGVELPENFSDLDYDASGNHLITASRTGEVTWSGAGESGTLGEGFIAVAW